MTLTTRLALAMIALVAIAVSAVGWFSYRGLEQAILPRVLDRTEIHAQLVAAELQSYLTGAVADIAGLRSNPALAGLIRARLAGGTDPVDGISEKMLSERIAGRVVSEFRAKPAYAEFRIVGLDDGQREILRVNRSGPDGAVRVVPEPELEPKGYQPYFDDTIRLNADQTYVSPVELDASGEGLASAPVPTLRIAAPLLTPDGNRLGIVTIKVDLRPAFERVRASARPGGAIYLVNKQGDYLVHPEPARELGSPPGAPASWPADFPYLASLAGTTQSTTRIAPDQTGRPGGIALAPAVLAGKQWIGVIETVPNAVILAPAAAIRNATLLVGLLAVLGAAALAVLIARSLTKPIVQLTAAVEGAARDYSSTIPVDASGETGVLARTFARMNQEANTRAIALEREVQEHLHTIAARDRLAERERLFSAAVESSNDPIITKSLDGTITGWNPAAERVFGYTAAEAIGKNIALIVPPDRLREVQDTLRRIGRGERIEHNETVRLRKDGTPVEVSLSISPIKAPSGATIGISKTVRDITESNKTQLALRQQTEERRRIFETSQDLILVMDSRGFLVQISPSCEAVLGYRPEEAIGRSAVDFIHPDDLENSRREMRLVRRGEPSKISDTRCIHKDGRTVWLSWLGTWSEPVERYFFVGRDMTERRQAQETLRESEQLARGIIDTALDAFVQVDQRGAIRDWNSQAETIFGWPREEALGSNIFELIALNPEQAPLRTDLQRFLVSGLDQVLRRRREVVVRRRDGKELTAELSVTALKTRDGFVFNGFLRDLTDKLAAEERIRQAEKMEAVGQLTGGIAHDFNNILTVITGTIEILADAVKNEPQLAAITKMIDEAASRGADLIQHLLAFARKQPLEPRETDVNALVIDTTKLLRRTLGEHVEVELVFEDEACLATVDPNQLATAILNLALNARDAMPRGGKLVIETASAVLDESFAVTHSEVRPGRYAMIAVSDTGTGIPAAMLERVFDPFFTSKGPGKGTGLGLSMVYGFVKQSAGHITIYSEEGQGTTIKMYLPPAAGVSLATGAALMPAVIGGNETILVVEDDKLVRDFVLTQLHSLGYVTLDAANAAEAMAIVNAGRGFDLLFTDVIMAGINGRQLANQISRIKPGLKVLFTSGYTENAIIHHGRLDEGVVLLAKPYRKSDMAIMIRKALAEESLFGSD
ncbi:PAS domain S-box protein [Bradyrhizobium sp.]|uniref:PAS domain S-box protein n=1 Tax=Bradyrhizobium sp. TaxID=376 RepID=UPI003C7145FE